MRAILSVSNKAGVVDFARGLRELGVDLYSTGGTKKAIDQAGVEVASISELTGFPEILDGRVKTLHPAVHGGILARRDMPEHMAALKENGISTIDLVVVNLYPFVETVSRSGVSLEDAIENIDIGGPTMIRSAAKNYESVAVVVDPDVVEADRNSEIDVAKFHRGGTVDKAAEKVDVEEGQQPVVELEVVAGGVVINLETLGRADVDARDRDLQVDDLVWLVLVVQGEPDAPRQGHAVAPGHLDPSVLGPRGAGWRQEKDGDREYCQSDDSVQRTLLFHSRATMSWA